MLGLCNLVTFFLGALLANDFGLLCWTLLNRLGPGVADGVVIKLLLKRLQPGVAAVDDAVVLGVVDLVTGVFWSLSFILICCFFCLDILSLYYFIRFTELGGVDRLGRTGAWSEGGASSWATSFKLLARSFFLFLCLATASLTCSFLVLVCILASLHKSICCAL